MENTNRDQSSFGFQQSTGIRLCWCVSVVSSIAQSYQVLVALMCPARSTHGTEPNPPPWCAGPRRVSCAKDLQRSTTLATSFPSRLRPAHGSWSSKPSVLSGHRVTLSLHEPWVRRVRLSMSGEEDGFATSPSFVICRIADRISCFVFWQWIFVLGSLCTKDLIR